MQKHYDAMPPVGGVNFVPLSPIALLQRAAEVYPEHPAVIYGDAKTTWRQLGERCENLAAGLASLGISRGDTVAVIAANTPELVEAHFGVPMSGGVLNAINTRLDAGTIAYILHHGDAKVLITDSHFSPTVAAALAELKNPPVVIDIVDSHTPPPAECNRLGEITYAELLNRGAAADKNAGVDFWAGPQNEWDALALNYTSGSTGRPKGVVYHHRGGYLIALGTVATWNLPKHPRYLYIVPMFHCNGWGHAWTMAAVGGTIICNRTMTAEAILGLIARHKITHFGGAPIILAMLAEAEAAAKKAMAGLAQRVQVMTAGAPPPANILAKVEKLGFEVLHVYGLTETYGHIMGCDWRAQWDELAVDKRAELKARQGVRMQMMQTARVVSDKGEPLPADGETIGEIALTGNTIMKGYYKNPEATAEAFRGGYFHSGDLAVTHADGYMQIKDRLKDIIISGGENISSIEVESVLYKHPAVAAAAVVAAPDEKWGEVPCAFVELHAGKTATAEEIIKFCRAHLSGFKTPKQVRFMALPKTSTGKIQKFQLRELAKQPAGE